MRIIKSHLIAQMSDIKTEILCTIISLQTFEKKKMQPNVAIYIPNHPVWPFIKRPTKLCFHFMRKL